MSEMKGSLTPMQHEILDAVWSADGITSSEIWQQISQRREVARTTILNQVDRLEKRGWLTRQKVDGNYHYRASIDRESAEQQLADQFVNHFFSGSASRLVASLFGGQQITSEDVDQIREMLDELPESNPNARKRK